MQNEFVGPDPIFPAPHGAEIIPRLQAFLRTVRGMGVRVIFTAYELREEVPPRGPLSKLLPAIGEGRAHRGAAAQIVQELTPEAGDIIVRKPRQSGFYATDLEVVLRSLGVDAVIICGVTTNVCCLATARDAAARDLNVILVSDLTAASDVKDADGTTIPADTVQRVTCGIVAHTIGQVACAADVVRWLTTGQDK